MIVLGKYVISNLIIDGKLMRNWRKIGSWKILIVFFGVLESSSYDIVLIEIING